MREWLRAPNVAESKGAFLAAEGLGIGGGGGRRQKRVNAGDRI